MCICVDEKQIRIIIVNGSPLSSAPSLPLENQHAAARAGWSAGTISLVFYVIYLYHAAEHSPIPITLRGPGNASASRTKLRISGLKPCAFGPTVSSRKKKKKHRDGGKRKDGRGGEREREKEEKRDCSSGRVQIEFHINVCKFPRSCWLRLEKLISWMQRQYWCHQAERRGEERRRAARR